MNFSYSEADPNTEFPKNLIFNNLAICINLYISFHFLSDTPLRHLNYPFQYLMEWVLVEWKGFGMIFLDVFTMYITVCTSHFMLSRLIKQLLPVVLLLVFH